MHPPVVRQRTGTIGSISKQRDEDESKTTNYWWVAIAIGAALIGMGT